MFRPWRPWLVVLVLVFWLGLVMQSPSDHLLASPAGQETVPVARILAPRSAIRPEGISPEEQQAWIQEAMSNLWRHEPDLETRRPAPLLPPAQNGLIAYVGAGGDLEVMNPDGSGQRPISTGLTNISDPAWSPDGRWIVLIADGATGRCLYKLELVTESHVPLACGFVSLYEPWWSPGGEHLAFAGQLEAGPLRSWALPAGGGIWTELAPSFHQVLSPRWLDDNTVMVSGEQPNNIFRLYLVDLEAPDAPRSITPDFRCSSDCTCADSDVYLAYPHLSPDGSTISFIGGYTTGHAKTGCTGYFALYLVDPLGTSLPSKIVEVANSSPGVAVAGPSRWAPDNQRVGLFASGSDGVMRIDVVDAAAGTLQQLYGRQGGDWDGLVWAPDGTQLATGYRPADAPPELDSVVPEDDLFTVLAQGDDPAWQEAGGSRLMPALTAFVVDSRQQIQTVSNAAVDASTVGDYFLDKIDQDRIEFVVGTTVNIVQTFFGVKWNQIGTSLQQTSLAGPEAGLRGSWQGWTDSSLDRHWSKLLYESIYENNELLFYQASWAFWKYVLGEEAVEVGADLADNLYRWLVPGAGTPVNDYFGSRAVELGAAYQGQLLQLRDRLVADLPALQLSSEMEEGYREDMLARQRAHAQLARHMVYHRDLLWASYQDRLADEDQWFADWLVSLARYAPIVDAALKWDGDGFVVASRGMAAIQLIYELVDDIRTLAQDEQMLAETISLLSGRVSLNYRQIALNTASAMSLIRSGEPPQIAQGAVGSVEMKSFGHYLFWPDIWWAEQSSQLQVLIINGSPYSTTFTTSATYTQTEFWAGSAKVSVEGETPQLAGGEQTTASIPLMFDGTGASPEQESRVDLSILGGTDTGLYGVAELAVNWAPERIETATGRPARAPAGLQGEEAEAAPARPFPIASVVVVPSGSAAHHLLLTAYNPFTLTVSATLTQTIPAGFSLVYSDGARLEDEALVWEQVLEPKRGARLEAQFLWPATPAEMATVPGAVLRFVDPATGSGDVYQAHDRAVHGAWPLDVSASIPMTMSSGLASLVPVTVTNVSEQVAAEGSLRLTVSTVDGSPLWTAGEPLSLAPGATQGLSFMARASTVESYAVVRCTATIDGVDQDEFVAIVAVEQLRFYLPTISRYARFVSPYRRYLPIVHRGR